MHADWGLIVNALAALGSFAAAAVAVWIATTDRKQRDQEREEADRKQAGLVRVKAQWAALGPQNPNVAVSVNNYGKLPIVDVAVTKWEWDINNNEADFATSEPKEAILPYAEDGGYAGRFVLSPRDASTKRAMSGELYPPGETHAGGVLKSQPTVDQSTPLTVTIEFTDAGEKRWRRSNKGLVERA